MKNRAAIAWLTACVAGSAAFMTSDFRPGRLGASRAAWPAESSLRRATDGPTILAFLHPRCPCTQGTLTRLLEGLRRHASHVNLVAVLYAPESTDDPAWTNSAYAQRIHREVPGAKLVLDRGGVEARRFDAWTSGTLLVYDRAGREVFRGGITTRRGADQDNPSSRRFFGRLGADDGRVEGAPVFGCPILRDGTT